MDLLTPFDLVETFAAGQSVAVVGNAPTLLGSGAGGWIDGHDIVVRFNDCKVRGFEDDVGARTDILVCNPYAETRPDSCLDELLPPVTVVAISSQTRRGDRAEFARWVGRNRVLFTYSPDLRLDTVERSQIALTTGTYGISLLANILRPLRMAVTGFTMFHPGTDFHYWSRATPSGIKSHEPATEAAVFVDLLNSFRFQIEATQDIFGIAERCGRTFRPGVKPRET
jgi:hypothetical protein